LTSDGYMNVLLTNTHCRGGAATACRRLRECLDVYTDINTDLLTKSHCINFESTVFPPQQKRFPGLKKAADRLIISLVPTGLSTEKKREAFLSERRRQGLELFTFPDSKIDITLSSGYQRADIINLHWVADYLDYTSFFALAGVENLHIVAPSRWLADEAAQSELFQRFPVHYIPNSVNPDIFTLKNKAFCRQVLGIPVEATVLLFVADSIENSRKGFEYLRRALEFIPKDDILLCSVGKSRKSISHTPDYLHLGSIEDERLISVVYSAADVFVIPSVMDNLPNTVVESLMCGTPVIGFPAGGIPEMLSDQQSGLIADEISVGALVKAIESFLTSQESFNRIKIRESALELYASYVQANSYRDLFNRILS